MIGTLLRPTELVVASSGPTVGLVVTSAAFFVVVRSSRPKMSKAAEGEGVLVVIHGGTITSGCVLESDSLLSSKQP